DGIRVMGNELALNLLQNAGGFGVEALDGESSPFGLELQRVAHVAIVTGLLAIAKRGRPAVIQQRFQRILLLKFIFRPSDLKPRPIPEDKSHRLFRNVSSSAGK